MQSLCIFNMCAAPQRERFDPPKVRRRFTLHVQAVHCATARAIRLDQSSQRVHFAFAQRARCNMMVKPLPNGMAMNSRQKCFFEAGRNEPIIQQKRNSSKRLYEHSKQNTSKQTPRKRRFHCTCNANVELKNTSPARRNDTSNLRRYGSRAGPTKAAHRKSSDAHVLRFPL